MTEVVLDNNLVRVENDKVLVSYDFLKSLGLKPDRIRVQCSKNLWVKHEIAGIKYIDYDSISSKYKKDHGLPTTIKIITSISDESNKKKQSEWIGRLSEIKEHSYESLTNNRAQYTIKYQVFCNGDFDRCSIYAQRHAVLQCIVDLVDKSFEKHYKSKDVLDAYLAWPENEIGGRKLFTEKTTMSHRIYNFLSSPEKTVIHGNYGKIKNKPKDKLILNDFTKWYIEYWYARPEAFTASTIHELVSEEIKKANEIRIQKGKLILPPISLAYVKYYLNRPELRNTAMRHRNKRQHNTRFTAFLRRNKPEYAGDVYMGDGTSSQIPYIDKNGKFKRASLFVFMDVMSSKITGHDIAENEDRHNLIDALHMAVKMEGIAPFEIVLDNASSTKTAEFTNIKKDMEKVGVNVRFAKVGNAKDKVYVERWNRHFQDNFERFIPGFVGGGVQSKIDRDRIDEEYLQSAARQKKLLSYDQLQKVVTDLVAKYNETVGSNNSTPNDSFRNSEKPNAFKLKAEQIAFMFWKSTVVTIRNQEITIEVKKQRRRFEFRYHDEKFKYNGEKVRVYYDEPDFSSVHVFDEKRRYLGNILEKTRVSVSMAGRDEVADLEIMKSHSNIEGTEREITENINKRAAKATEYVENEIDIYDAVNPIALKTKINSAESKIYEDMYFNGKGIDQRVIPEPEPVNIDSPYTNPNYGKPNINENPIKKKASLEPVDQDSYCRDDI